MNAMWGAARAAWRYRDFVLASVRREFSARYLGTQLGFFWAIAQPLALILIYTLVFSEIMRPALPGHSTRFAYSIYLTSGVIVWTLFSDVLGRGVGIFVHNANLLKKVSVPKITLPAIAVLSSLVNFAIVLALFLAFLLLSGHWPGWPLLALPGVVAVALAFAMGLGLLLATLNVFYRDVEQTVGIVLQFWFWLTPIVYPWTALPAPVQRVLQWNPMWSITRAVQDIFLERQWPSLAQLWWPALMAFAFVLLAYRVFVRLSDELVDEL
jgi:lipopolysaccharide transport system permease protein